MISKKFACITTILCAVIITGGAIKCHMCNSFEDPKCSDVAPSDNATLVECPREKAFCRKTFQYVMEEDMTRITRNCGWIQFEKHSGDYCVVSNTNFKKEVSCQCFADGCNAGGRLEVASLLFLSIVFVIIALSGC